MSYQLTSQNPPSTYRPSLAPFYWATGGRATLDTRLPLDLTVPLMPGQTQEEDLPAEEEEQGATPEPQDQPAEEAEDESAATATAPLTDEEGRTGICSFLPVSMVLILPAWVTQRRRRKRKRRFTLS
jgi:hypothetical protein